MDGTTDRKLSPEELDAERERILNAKRDADTLAELAHREWLRGSEREAHAAYLADLAHAQRTRAAHAANTAASNETFAKLVAQLAQFAGILKTRETPPPPWSPPVTVPGGLLALSAEDSLPYPNDDPACVALLSEIDGQTAILGIHETTLLRTGDRTSGARFGALFDGSRLMWFHTASTHRAVLAQLRDHLAALINARSAT